MIYEPEYYAYLSFDKYKSNNARSVYNNIPITELSLFKSVLQNTLGRQYRIRYRGIRRMDYKRTWNQRQSECLKSNAEYFSVYRK
jgi:hypothetical protein